jgi:hypothetical protein
MLAQLSDIDGPLKWAMCAGILFIFFGPVVIALIIMNRPKHPKAKRDPRSGFEVLPPEKGESPSSENDSEI